MFQKQKENHWNEGATDTKKMTSSTQLRLFNWSHASRDDWVVFFPSTFFLQLPPFSRKAGWKSPYKQKPIFIPVTETARSTGIMWRALKVPVTCGCSVVDWGTCDSNFFAHHAAKNKSKYVVSEHRLRSFFHKTILKDYSVEDRGMFCTAHGPCLISRVWLVFLGSADYINVTFEWRTRSYFIIILPFSSL